MKAVAKFGPGLRTPEPRALLPREPGWLQNFTESSGRGSQISDGEEGLRLPETQVVFVSPDTAFQGLGGEEKEEQLDLEIVLTGESERKPITSG